MSSNMQILNEYVVYTKDLHTRSKSTKSYGQTNFNGGQSLSISQRTAAPIKDSSCMIHHLYT